MLSCDCSNVTLGLGYQPLQCVVGQVGVHHFPDLCNGQQGRHLDCRDCGESSCAVDRKGYSDTSPDCLSAIQEVVVHIAHLNLDTLSLYDLAEVREVTDDCCVLGGGICHDHRETPERDRACLGRMPIEVDSVCGLQQPDILPIVGMNDKVRGKCVSSCHDFRHGLVDRVRHIVRSLGLGQESGSIRDPAQIRGGSIALDHLNIKPLPDAKGQTLIQVAADLDNIGQLLIGHWNTRTNGANVLGPLSQLEGGLSVGSRLRSLSSGGSVRGLFHVDHSRRVGSAQEG